MRKTLAAALLAGLMLHGAALAQPAAHAEGMRALRAAEAELRDTLTRLDQGSLPGSMAMSRLRQALNEVERAMLRLPAGARQGPNWQEAVKEVSEAMTAARDEGAEPRAVREAAGEALGTLRPLMGEDAGTGGG